MLLSGALSPELKRLDLEGSPQLSDASLLEMLEPTRSSLESLRLLGTAVSDVAFVNGLDQALAPTLKELRLSGGSSALGDATLECLAEARRFRGLERFAIGGRSFSHHGVSTSLTGAESLRALFLSDCAVNDKTIDLIVQEAPRLEEIGISGCFQVTNVALQALRRLPLV